ncbi:MAG: glycosyltransferase [Thermodesulfobacteriota bacterium]
MNILNLEGQYFVPYFRRAGHQVLTIGPGPGHDLPLAQPLSLAELWAFLQGRGFLPDLVVWNDICRPPAVIGFERLPAVTIGYSIDQYCNPWHVHYSAAFDLILVAQRDYLPLFQKDGLPRRCQWFPLFCDPATDKDLKLERDLPVSFVGTLKSPLNPGRWPFLQEFQQHHPLHLDQGAYAPIFARSQLVLNQSAVGELNFRLFQGMACGAAVLTEQTLNGLRNLFIPGEEILTYPKGDAPAAARQAREALAQPDRLRALAQAGRRKVLMEHSAPVRAKKLLAWAEELSRSDSRQFRQKNQERLSREMAQAYLLLATDGELGLPAPLRQFYADLGMTYAAAP